MRVFVVSGTVPFRHHGVPGVIAANLVFAQIIAGLQSLGHDIVLQCLFHHGRREEVLSPAEEEELSVLRRAGVEVLPPIFAHEYLSTYHPQRFRAFRLLVSSAECLRHFYPATILAPRLAVAMKQVKSDVVLTLWSPAAVAALSLIKDIPCVAYHGDIDDMPMRCQFQDRAFFRNRRMAYTPRSLYETADQWLRLQLFRRTHLRVMNRIAGIANIDAGNSAYYAAHGHSCSTYVGNTWPLSPTPLHQSAPNAVDRPLKIIGHAGYLDRTGSTYGLRFLLESVVPSLPHALQGRPYEVHIIGGGQPIASLRPLFHQNHVVVRGFVEDLDAELLSSDVFCILNNAGPYHSAYTRHLLAWSLGLCLIAHRRSTIAIPEVVHERNALVGETGEEIALCIARAATDADLNNRLRLGGRQTYKQHFTPDLIAMRIDKILQRVSSPWTYCGSRLSSSKQSLYSGAVGKAVPRHRRLGVSRRAACARAY